MSARGRSLALISLGILAGACGVSEQVLRDEQARARRFREAWETQGAELQALRERVALLEVKGCAVPANKPAADASGPSTGVVALPQKDVE